ncbi:hypothetical protein CVT26_006308 [Gymnopilus dilepis]|uniref:Glycosyltransferase 2-like domain-containing protein n=1 Tax=Gymnopilus dilepis TaxID=231916 RepID=A0A409Y0P7_9AGAR|nr:hypothetical protein CVT26_006308 [Gymnopilus dilepis]
MSIITSTSTASMSREDPNASLHPSRVSAYKRRDLDWMSASLAADEGLLPTPAYDRILQAHSFQGPAEKLALDIVIPTYRLHLPTLQTTLSLRPSPTCSVTFILVIDNPVSTSLPALQSLVASLSSHPDSAFRVLVNSTNIGAPASRNAGLSASTAPWVHFLDDDVLPSPALLVEAEKAIRAHPEAAGFVGVTKLPKAEGVFGTAVGMTGMVGFWDLAERLAEEVEMPWGITANLIVRRKAVAPPRTRGSTNGNSDNLKDIPDRPLFDPSYPKPGGGEDIDFCLRQTRWSRSSSRNGPGFLSAPKVFVQHPWWDNGRRSYRRFFTWGVGGVGLLEKRFFTWGVGGVGLLEKFPEHTYLDGAPNTAEILLGCGLLCALGICTARLGIIRFSFKAALSATLARILHDIYAHISTSSCDLTIRTTFEPNTLPWLLAIIESSIIGIVGEAGFVRGLISRGQYGLFGRRFDWFAGSQLGPKGFVQKVRRDSWARATLGVLIFGGISLAKL